MAQLIDFIGCLSYDIHKVNKSQICQGHSSPLLGSPDWVDTLTPGPGEGSQQPSGDLGSSRAMKLAERRRKKMIRRLSVMETLFLSFPGEPFSQEEMEEMLSAAVDPESNSIHYKDYIAMMVVDES